MLVPTPISPICRNRPVPFDMTVLSTLSLLNNKVGGIHTVVLAFYTLHDLTVLYIDLSLLVDPVSIFSTVLVYDVT
jgi:hypothetical protein